MKVLHLPNNLASQMRVTVLALRELGIEARGLTGPSPQQNAAGLEILPRGAEDKFASRKWQALRRHGMVLRAIAWADVVHWHYGPALTADADVRLAQLLGRKRFVEFWGSDVRDPEREMEDNPWFAEVWRSGEYECASESRSGSRRMQQRFASRGVKALVPCENVAQYVLPEFFPDSQRTAQRVLLHEYSAALPAPVNARPLIVHAPTAIVAKGSRHIMAAAERLKGEFDFDFKLIHGMSPGEARDWMSRCDIFVDQIIGGDYGLAAVEAMALGKPVICYIKPSLRPLYPAHFPIISADPSTIEAVLRGLIQDGPRRRAAGEASRAWVEERHDARKVVAKIAEYYQAA